MDEQRHENTRLVQQLETALSDAKRQADVQREKALSKVRILYALSSQTGQGITPIRRHLCRHRLFCFHTLLVTLLFKHSGFRNVGCLNSCNVCFHLIVLHQNVERCVGNLYAPFFKSICDNYLQLACEHQIMSTGSIQLALRFLDPSQRDTFIVLKNVNF